MEGVLDTLLGILTKTIAASLTEDNIAPAEDYLPGTQTAVMVDQPASDHTVASVHNDKLIGKSESSNDVRDSQKTVEEVSDHVLSDVVENASQADVNFASNTEFSDLCLPEPQSSVPLPSSNIASESLTDSDTVTEKGDTDDGVIIEESLMQSLPPLSEVPLTIPLCPPRYLKLSLLPSEELVCGFWYHYR